MNSAADQGPGLSASPARARRETVVALVGCILGSVTVLFAAAATWVTVRVAPTPGSAGTVAPVTLELGGADLAPAAASLGLVGLAGVVAVAATRRFGRVVVGAVLLAAGIGVAVVAGRVAVDPVPAVLASAPFAEVAPPDAAAALLEVSQSIAAPASCAGGGVLALVGLLVAVRGRSWPALAGRYQARPAVPADAWEEIERGQDPTSPTGGATQKRF